MEDKVVKMLFDQMVYFIKKTKQETFKREKSNTIPGTG